MSLIEVQNVERTYLTGEIETKALCGVNLEISAGEFICLSGWSGSGKTTLLNLIGTLDSPTQGTILVAGQDPAELSDIERTRFRLHKIGFVFQAYNLIPVLSGYENAEMLLLLQGVSAKARKEQVMPLLEILGIADIAHKKPAQMSGGQQQRFAVARAIASEPSIVLADEPTANLDSTTSIELISYMKQLNQNKGITFLFSSHDSIIHERAERVIELRDGKVFRDSGQVCVA